MTQSRHESHSHDPLFSQQFLPISWRDVMPALDVGDQVADLTFLRPDGTAARLSEFPGPLLLIFLRHLRCISCLVHLVQVRERLDEIQSVGADVLVVTQSHPEAVSAGSLPLPTV